MLVLLEPNGSVTCQWLADGQADALLHWHWEELQARQALLRDTLGSYDLSTHLQGFHGWLRLLESWRTADFVKQAEARSVTLIAPEPFCVGTHPAP